MSRLSVRPGALAQDQGARRACSVSAPACGMGSLVTAVPALPWCCPAHPAPNDAPPPRAERLSQEQPSSIPTRRATRLRHVGHPASPEPAESAECPISGELNTEGWRACGERRAAWLASAHHDAACNRPIVPIVPLVSETKYDSIARNKKCLIASNRWTQRLGDHRRRAVLLAQEPQRLTCS